jgi:stage II sporulation SpoAA-like protein
LPLRERRARTREADMLASTVLPDTNIVVIMYGGPVRTEELLDAREEVDRVVRRCAAARLLVEHCDRDSIRIEPKAMWADLTTAHVLRGVERVAVVADAWWIDRVADGAATMTDVEARGFDTTRHDDAVAWLRS